MVRLQALCGARSGEITQLRPCDVDRSGRVWIFKPHKHKSMHKGRGRAIPLGPRAQEILAPWLDGESESYAFTPAEAVERQNAERRRRRKTKVHPSQAARTRKAKPKRRRRPRYDSAAYYAAVSAACDRAGVPRWGPHRLRHAVATEVRRRYGLEAAQALLGHAKADVTEIYAERDLSKAVEVMGEVG
jgi:integrase